MTGVPPTESANRPRLLVLASTYPRWVGDPEPGFVHELARRLVDRFDVTVLCPHAAGASPRERLDGVDVMRYRYAPAVLETLVNDGGIVTNLRRKPWTWLLVPGFLLAQVWALWRLVRRMRPAVIHAHWIIPQGLIVALLGMIGVRMPPFLVTSHGADLFALRGRVLSSLKRFVLRRAAAATVVSEGMRDEIARLGIDATRVRVEPMGVDLSARFHPDSTVPRSRNELLFVGRLVEKKGLRYLLDAMPQVLAQRPDATLTVVGFGPEEDERRRQVEQLGIAGQVNFVGAVAQAALPAFYRRAAVFVAPFVQAASGDQEGLGLVLVEALGCGCPVVVSRLPATARLIDRIDGLTGVESGDTKLLAEALIAALHDHVRVEPGVVAEFDWPSRADNYARALMQIVGAA